MVNQDHLVDLSGRYLTVLVHPDGRVERPVVHAASDDDPRRLYCWYMANPARIEPVMLRALLLFLDEWDTIPAGHNSRETLDLALYEWCGRSVDWRVSYMVSAAQLP